uniref:dnaJ homolog subfamily A member 4-like isoform X2 n=1 Tax=Pristiophorus japonicus TaxID=55135 RepID=UPI00398F74C9
MIHTGKDVVHQLAVSLEDIYNGATRKLALKKNVICDKCDGCGGKKGSVEKCPNCKGRGIEIHIQQIGLGMVQQIQTMCSECHGQCEHIDPKDRCKNCNGRKIMKERKILEVHIDKGMQDGQKITFRGEGDQEPGLDPGDVVIVLDQKDHDLFRRHGNNLIMKMEILLVEALCGFKRTVITLDKRTLLITSKPGDVMRVGNFKSVLNEGLPIYRDPFEKGQLMIQFSVKFPPYGWIPAQNLTELEDLLPPRQKVAITADMEQVELTECLLEEQRKAYCGEAYKEDQKPRGGVQCQTS